jgi:serine protease
LPDGVERIDRQFLVVLRSSSSSSFLNADDVTSVVRDVTENSPCRAVRWTYTETIKGFAVRDCSEEDLAELLDNDAVEHAVPDHFLRADVVEQDVGDFLWGLDRLDQGGRPLDSKYRYEYDGTGVQVYIFDTGIRETHAEFGGGGGGGGGRRASCGFNALEGRGEPCTDTAGHGTFVAGIVGGETHGVAKNATLIAVRVLRKNLKGSVSDVLAGIEYVAREKKNNPDTPMVANMSFNTFRAGGIGCLLDLRDPERDFEWGCWRDDLKRTKDLENAVNALVDTGVVVTVSAGNRGSPACWFTPANAAKAITVGATMQKDRKWTVSNYGRCVDIFAPGRDIRSAWYTSDQSVFLADGTSFAAPFVAGAAALYLQRDPTLAPSEVLSALLADASAPVRFRRLLSPNALVSTKGLLEGFV